jgi:DNA-binding response OmpR family regulator
MGDRKRILVIDDNRALASAAERILQKQDFEVITALNGADGYDKAKEEKPDVIILDVITPGIDGYEVGYQLRQDHDTSDIPIIFLSAEENTNSKKGAYTVGSPEINIAFECDANDFLQKPVAADDLVRSVKNVIWFSAISALA